MLTRLSRYSFRHHRLSVSQSFDSIPLWIFAVAGTGSGLIFCSYISNKFYKSLGDQYLSDAFKLESEGLDEEALLAYTEACKFNKHEASPWLFRGNTFERLRRDEEALDCYTIAERKQKDKAMTQHYKARVLLKLKRLDEAEDAAKRCLQLDGEDYRHRFDSFMIELNDERQREGRRALNIERS
eukprot:TRINITY_DN2481_c0_g1_i2.p1 TRINITY_DN2481_c0_g1~~TRINITY_DN2481_c0_g1_i2.p1  ORF type:complete len:184 (-),score=27.65 TRINITY_DN2481_c0_g1_i2:80-631(-)